MNAIVFSVRRIKSTALRTNYNLLIARCIRSNEPHLQVPETTTESEELLKRNENEDMPIFNMDNPYVKEKQQCVLCKHKIKLDFKNAQLLSQFVSQFTGRVYGKHVTGLCEKQHKRLEMAVELSKRAGLMPYHYKDLRFLNDPRLFDVSNVGKKM